MCLRVQVVPILSEDVNEPVVVRLALGEANGGGVQVLLEQSLQLRLGVILIQAFHLCVRVCVGGGGSSLFGRNTVETGLLAHALMGSIAELHT